MDTKRKDAAALADERDAKRSLTGRAWSASASASPATEDVKLYCVCRQAYDDDRLMMACDVCDEWFHASCMRVAEHDVELIDTFVCAPCAKRTAQRTSFKVPCGHRACRRPARLPMSRYCSDACGLAEIRARMDVMHVSQDTHHITCAPKDARRGVVMWMHGDQAPREPPPGTSWGAFVRQHATRLDTREHDTTQLHTELKRLERQCAALHASLDLLSVRSKLLQHADDRPAGSACGFDAHLCMDDEALAAWTLSPQGRAVMADQDGASGAADVCDVPKRQCKRHADWSAIRAADLDVLRDIQTAQLSALSERSHALRIAMELHS